MKNNQKVFKIIDFEENIDNEFDKIVDLSRGCKFSDCTHTNETDCTVKKAIADGTLPEETFNNYFIEKNQAAYVSKQKNKTKAIDYMKQRKLFKDFS